MVDPIVANHDSDVNSFCAAALEYAARGWAVFPLPARSKIPVKGSHGFLDATTDLDQIAAWWAAEPGANIGIATGPSGLLVLDVDGDQGRAALNGRHLPPTPTAMTGKGVHYYYQGDGPCKVGVLPGLDIRSDGGYVVAPPSVHPSGAVYCWADGLSPADLPLAPAPDWLTELLTADGPRNPSPVLPETIHAGRRNATLVSLAGSMRRRGATADAILAALQVENSDRCRPPLPETELRQIAESVGRYAPAPEAATAAEGAVLFDPGDPTLHYTDSGLAERLIRLYGANLRHCWGRGQWLQWTSTHWLADDGSEVHRMAGEVPRAMLRAAADIRDPEDRGPAVKFAIASESSVKRSAAVSLARSIRGVPVAPEALDANLWILNCINGTIDLRTGDLLPHRREDLCTRMAPVEFDPEARLDLWDRFLEEATGGDQELVRFLAQVAGMAVTGDVSAEVFAFAYGPTRSGKSTFLSALINALGPYAHVADFASFCTGPAATPGAHRDDVAAMESRRLVVAAETSKGRGFDAGTLKNLTGGDVVNARPAYGRTRNFKPQFTLMLAANDRPRADDLDEALWRRLLEVPFRHTVPADRVDPSMKGRLSDPGDGGPAVLAWAVAGCLDWQENGLTIPAAVAEASAEYRADVDPLAEFLLDCCVLAPEAQAPAGTLYETYREYALANGMKPMGNRAFGKRLSARGFDVSVVREGSKAQRIRRGIGLLDVEMLR